MSNHFFVGMVRATALSLCLVGCQDPKAREENEQLKAHVLQLQKDAGELGNRIDVLTKQNADLRDEIERLKRRRSVKKNPKSKAHRKTSSEAAGSQNGTDAVQWPEIGRVGRRSSRNVQLAQSPGANRIRRSRPWAQGVSMYNFISGDISGCTSV